MSSLRFIEFQLPSLVGQPPEGDDWIHEIKWDGYRTELLVANRTARAFTRRGFDWSNRYRPIVEAAAALHVKSAIIDGEIVVLDDKGVSNIGLLRSAMRLQPERMIFVAFDLLHLDGEDLRFKPLIERRARLQEIIPDDGAIQLSQHLEGDGAAFFAEADRLGLEGIVSKRASAPYRSGRTETWLKIKCFEESIYEIAAVLREPAGRQSPTWSTPTAIMSGAPSSAASTRDMRERLWQRVTAKAGPPAKGLTMKPGAEWVQPGLTGHGAPPEGRGDAAPCHAAGDRGLKQDGEQPHDVRRSTGSIPQRTNHRQRQPLQQAG